MIGTTICSCAKLVNKQKVNTRLFYHWINKVFNQLDYERLEKLGPDRVCAEWLLRNGAAVQWVGATTYLKDYNGLPREEEKFFIEKVDATNSSISHYGFLHFRNCSRIQELILHNCSYIEDTALKLLPFLTNSLEHLEVSKCHNVTDTGLLYLKELSNLKTLKLSNFTFVKDKKKVLTELKQNLTKCNITSDFETDAEKK